MCEDTNPEVIPLSLSRNWNWSGTWPAWGHTLDRECWLEDPRVSDLNAASCLIQMRRMLRGSSRTTQGPHSLPPWVATYLPAGGSLPLTNFQLPGFILLFPQMLQSLVEFPLKEIKTSWGHFREPRLSMRLPSIGRKTSVPQAGEWMVDVKGVPAGGGGGDSDSYPADIQGRAPTISAPTVSKFL